MPHLTVEHSANLEARLDTHALCRCLLDAIAATGAIEPGAPRIRAVSCPAYAIADDDPRNVFIDMSLRLGAGRDARTKRAIGEAVFSAAQSFCAALLAEPYFALSLEVREIDPALSWKHNSIHKRLKP